MKAYIKEHLELITAMACALLILLASIIVPLLSPESIKHVQVGEIVGQR